MRTYHEKTMVDLHKAMVESLIFAKPDELDIISNVDVQIHNVSAYADSMVWDFNLKNLWLTKSRWSMMVRQYIDPADLTAWIDMCTSKIGKKGRGIAVLRTKMVKPRGGAATGHTNKETRRWGSCMLSISYKALPKPQITLHSRTSYLGYIGSLDLSVAWMAARYLAEEIGLKMEDISFLWYNEAIQWHNFKSMAWMLSNPDPTDRTEYRALLTKQKVGLTDEQLQTMLSCPAVKMTRQWLTKVRKEDRDGLTYGDMSYNTYRRIRRRWHTEVLGYEKAQTFEGWSTWKKGPQLGENKEFFKAYGPLPDVWIGDLDFGCIKMPLGKRYGGDYVESDNEEDEDDE